MTNPFKCLNICKQMLLVTAFFVLSLVGEASAMNKAELIDAWHRVRESLQKKPA